MDLKKTLPFSFKIVEKETDRPYDMGGRELLTVRCRSQRERDERKIKWIIFPDRLGSCLHFIYA